jgi:hypothetical protein
LPRDVAAAGFVFIPAGTLDTEPNIRPQARIFQDSRASWSCSAEEIPAFPDYPK